jgi:fructose/tagatose bisphosphate aldolase
MEWRSAIFNIADLVLLKAVVAAGQELKVPVIVGVSEGEREFFRVRQIAALVQSLREEYDRPIFLNADHTHSLPQALEVARAGFDAIVFDLSAIRVDAGLSGGPSGCFFAQRGGRNLARRPTCD